MADWLPIEQAPRDGTFQWIGRDGEYSFADWMRYNISNRRWEFSDGSYLGGKSYGSLFFHPLPGPPAKGIEAAQADETRSGSAEGESPVRDSAFAHTQSESHS